VNVPRFPAVAIVGHSNVGKTSIVAALTRDATLDVAEEAGTTRRRYAQTVHIGGQPVLAFLDTPGFERASAVNAWLDAAASRASAGADGVSRPSQAPDGPTLLRSFVDDPGTQAEFSQEIEALRGVLEADLLAFVADVSLPPQGQQRQELRLLRRAGVPMLVLLNFLLGEHEPAWVDLLRREGVDSHVRLDAAAFPAEQERDFYAALGHLRPEFRSGFERVLGLRAAQARSARGRAALCVSSLLVDCLSYRLIETWPDRASALAARAAAAERFRSALREREADAFSQLAEIYGFSVDVLRSRELSVDAPSGDWRADLWEPATLRRYGASLGTLGAAGALTGFALDSVGGHGVGTALGFGAGIAAGLFVGRRVATEVDAAGRLTVGPVDPVRFPQVLLGRGLACARHLASRSHARRDAWELPAAGALAVPPPGSGPGGEGSVVVLVAGDVARLARLAARCRRNPAWSGIAAPGAGGSADASRFAPAREDVVGDLAALAEALLLRGGGEGEQGVEQRRP
jgi:small GTP-binding protein